MYNALLLQGKKRCSEVTSYAYGDNSEKTDVVNVSFFDGSLRIWKYCWSMLVISKSCQ